MTQAPIPTGSDKIPRESTIVIFSDDPVSARLLKQILQHGHYGVRQIRTAALLLSTMAEQPADLILLDVVSPGEDIYTLCKELKRTATTLLTPVIFVSTFQQATDKVMAFEAGGVDYLTKPFHPAEVLARVDHHLQVARLQRELKQDKRALEQSYEQLQNAHQRISLMTGVLSEQLTGKLLDGKYLMGEKLDSGGFGIVYHAQQVALQRAVAVKILRLPRPDRAQSQLERFRREGISASRVAHPNVVLVLDSGVSPEGIPYLVMELLKGQSLKARLEKCGGALPVAECLRIIKSVCEVLAEAHDANVIHRDIKPDNIFLHQGTDGEIAKVLDFGIATLHGADDRTLTRLTNPDVAVGTALYMAPERMQDDGEDGQCDVYSLAVTLYIMLCGQPPFLAKSDDPVSMMFCHYYEAPIPLHEQNSAIPEQLAALVMRGLIKDPKQRPTAREFLAELKVLSAP